MRSEEALAKIYEIRQNQRRLQIYEELLIYIVRTFESNLVNAVSWKIYNVIKYVITNNMGILCELLLKFWKGRDDWVLFSNVVFGRWICLEHPSLLFNINFLLIPATTHNPSSQPIEIIDKKAKTEVYLNWNINLSFFLTNASEYSPNSSFPVPLWDHFFVSSAVILYDIFLWKIRYLCNN